MVATIEAREALDAAYAEPVSPEEVEEAEAEARAAWDAECDALAALAAAHRAGRHAADWLDLRNDEEPF
ncbi:MAG TPA: hypothetical protein VFL91_33205 [Thermomicrobiales bacterium]|nr:hypothetical protein [Thermomicrobiales bacterium]